MKSIFFLLFFFCIATEHLYGQFPCMDAPTNLSRNYVEIPTQKKVVKTAKESAQKYVAANSIISTTHRAARTASINLPDFATLINRETFCNNSSIRLPFSRDICREKKEFMLEVDRFLRELCSAPTRYKATNGMIRQIENKYSEIMTELLMDMH